MLPSHAGPADQRSPARRQAKRGLVRVAVALGIGAAWLAVASLAVFYVGGAMVAGAARVVALLPRAIVWLFIAMQQGADWWSIAGRVGATLAETLTTSRVAFSVIALELVGAAALYVLQRLVRDEDRGASSEEVEK